MTSLAFTATERSSPVHLYFMESWLLSYIHNQGQSCSSWWLTILTCNMQLIYFMISSHLHFHSVSWRICISLSFIFLTITTDSNCNEKFLCSSCIDESINKNTRPTEKVGRYSHGDKVMSPLSTIYFLIFI